MERLQQALERARQQRQVLQPPATAADPAVDALPQPTQVVYDQTRRIPVSTETLQEHFLISTVAEDEAATPYKILRTQVLKRMLQFGGNVLAVTSAAPGAGKTLTATNLAISLAMEENHTVLLADLDLRRPSVHRHFAITPEYGIADCLDGSAQISQALINPGIPRLVLLPCRAPVANSAEVLASSAMTELVHELKARYPKRIVLFDLPPLLSCADALAFCPYVDAVLLVVEDGGTRREQLQRAMELLHDVNVLGTVLNKAVVQGQTYY